MHVLAVEYPGYGLYKTSKPDEEKMKEDADTVYDYLTQVAGVKESDVILFCLLYTSPSPRDRQKSRMPSSA